MKGYITLDTVVNNVRSVKKDTKRSSVLLLRLVSFFMERTLGVWKLFFENNSVEFLLQIKQDSNLTPEPTFDIPRDNGLLPIYSYFLSSIFFSYYNLQINMHHLPENNTSQVQGSVIQPVGISGHETSTHSSTGNITTTTSSIGKTF